MECHLVQESSCCLRTPNIPQIWQTLHLEWSFGKSSMTCSQWLILWTQHWCLRQILWSSSQSTLCLHYKQCDPYRSHFSSCEWRRWDSWSQHNDWQHSRLEATQQAVLTATRRPLHGNRMCLHNRESEQTWEASVHMYHCDRFKCCD